MNIKLKGMMDGRNTGKVKTLLQDIVRIRHLGKLTNQAANFSTVRSSAHVLQISNGEDFSVVIAKRYYNKPRFKWLCLPTFNRSNLS